MVWRSVVGGLVLVIGGVSPSRVSGGGAGDSTATGGGGAVDAVPDLERYAGLRVGLGELGRVFLVAPDAYGDGQVREESLDVALHAPGKQLGLLQQLAGLFSFGEAEEED